MAKLLNQRELSEGLTRIIDELADILQTKGNVTEPCKKISKRIKYRPERIMYCYLGHEPVTIKLYNAAERTLKEEQHGKKKEEKPEITEWTVPKFAFFELVNELLRREYKTTTSIDEKLGNTDTYIDRQYNGKLSCTEEMYYRLVGLLIEKELTKEETEKLKKKNRTAPEQYNITGTYEIGQIVTFPQGQGIILMKRLNNRIIAAMEDENIMTYLEKGEGHSEIFRRPFSIENMVADAKGSYRPR